MFAPKKILFPLDYSNVAQKALTAALRLIDNHGSKLYLLHVDSNLDNELQKRIVSDPLGDTIEQAIATEETALINALNAAYAEAAEAGHDLKRGELELLVTGGDLFEVILQVAKSEQIDLIITGTHGRKGVMSHIKGSISEQLVNKAACSVFVVKPDGYPYLRD